MTSTRIKQAAIDSDPARGDLPAAERRAQLAHPARPRSRWRLHGGVLLVFTLGTIAATWPLFPQMGGFVVTRDDPVQAIWEMAWQAHALATNPLGLFNANINFPFQGTLTFNDLSFAEAVLGAPIYGLLGNPVFSHNAVILCAYILAGYGTWLLAYQITGCSGAGLVAGSSFAFSFYMLNNLQHSTPVSAEWLPFTLLAAYQVLWTGRWRWVLALALFFALNALSSHYLAFYAAILLGLFAGYYGLALRQAGVWRRLGQIAIGLGLGGLLVLPIAIPYVLVQGSYHFSRDLFQVERFSNTLVSFLAVYRANPVYQALLAPFADHGPWPVEQSAFPGLVAPGLGVLGLIWAWRRRQAAAPAGPGADDRPGRGLWQHGLFYALVALVSAVLSLGPSLQVTYAASAYDPSTVQRIAPLPYLLLYRLVPGFASMRVASRIDVLLALALALLAGIGVLAVRGGLATWLARRRARWVAWPALVAVLTLLPLLESWSAPLPLYPIATRAAVPPVYGWLAAQPPTAILEYPMVLKERGPANVYMENLVQYYSVYHWQRLVNGSVTIRPYAYSALIRETEDCFPCPRSLDALSLLGVQYVVVHLDNLTAAQRTDFLWRSTAPAAKVVDTFLLVQDFGADRVYRVVSPRPVSEVQNQIPPGASILLDTPEHDPIKAGDEDHVLIGGGYMATLGWYLRDHPLYGDARLTFGQPIGAVTPATRPDYALLWAGQDPTAAGYQPQDRVWANEFVVLYRRAARSASTRASRATAARATGTIVSQPAGRPMLASVGRSIASRVPVSRKRQCATICDHSGVKNICVSAAVPET
ncbi:MAG TPA: hypothetical protein VKY74_21285 [Chloroflexia bacterium]|nr:hypothetical protein [Chloroflexia bacterium]